jgi:hypothetical protein
MNEKVQRRFSYAPKSFFLGLQLARQKPPDRDEDVAPPNCRVQQSSLAFRLAVR